MSRPLTALLAASVLAVGAPTPVSACNPDEGCGGLSADELARDRAEIRRLNREQKRYVDRRDAEYARGWAARRDYSRAVAEYEREMEAWRESVRRCRAGDYRYCDH
jgi:hypothetical protein